MTNVELKMLEEAAGNELAKNFDQGYKLIAADIVMRTYNDYAWLKENSFTLNGEYVEIAKAKGAKMTGEDIAKIEEHIGAFIGLLEIGHFKVLPN